MGTNLVSAQEILPQKGHTGMSFAMAVHPNGRYVATSGNDIRIWDVQSRRLLYIFDDFQGGQHYLQFSPDPNSHLLLTTSDEDDSARLWDISNGSRVHTYALGRNFLPSGLSWSSKAPEQFKVMGYREWKVFSINQTDVVDQQMLASELMDGAGPEANENGLRDLDVLLTANRLTAIPELEAMAMRKGDTLHLLPLAASSWSEATTLALGSHMYSLDYCASQSLLAVATEDDFQVFDLKKGWRVFIEPNKWSGYEHNIRISEDGEKLFLDNSDDAQVIEWKTRKSLLYFNSKVQIAEFAMDDQYLIVGGWASPYIFNLDNRSRVDMDVFQTGITGIDLLGSDTLILQDMYERQVYFDLEQMEYVAGEENAQTTVHFNGATNEVLVTQGEQELHRFTVDFEINGVPIAQIPDGVEKLTSLQLSPDGRYLYAMAIVKDPRTKEESDRWGSGEIVVDVRSRRSYSLDGFRRKVVKYDVQTGELLRSSKQFKNFAPYSVLLVNDGTELIVTSLGEITLLDSKKLKKRKDLSPEQPKDWYLEVKRPLYVKERDLILINQKGSLFIWSTTDWEQKAWIQLPFGYRDSVQVLGSKLLISGWDWTTTHNLAMIDLDRMQLSEKAMTSSYKIKDMQLIGDVLMLLYTDGSLDVWSVTQWRSLARCLLDPANKEYVFYLEDGRYFGTKTILKWLRMSKGLQSYEVSQFDASFNRPHEVLGSLPFASGEKKALLQRLFEKRMGQGVYQPLDLDGAPVLEVNPQPFETNSPLARVQIKASSEQVMTHLDVWANGVPVFGIDGLAIRPSNSIDTLIKIQLVQGYNDLHFRVRDINGKQSAREKRRMKSTFYASMDTVFLINIGVSDYLQSDWNLSYAAKDAEDLQRTFDEHNQKYHFVHLVPILLTDSMVTQAQFMKLKDRLAHCRPQDRIILSMSGHGMLDQDLQWWFAPYDMDFNAPEKKGISYQMIIDILANSPARKKVLLLDACHSGELDRSVSRPSDLGEGVVQQGVRGMRVSRSSLSNDQTFDLMKEYFLDLTAQTGVHVISAASGDSYALESGAWNNGVFSYTVMQALLQIHASDLKTGLTIGMLRDYVKTTVPQLTKGQQRPMTRGGNPEFDFIMW